jgi:integrase
MILTLQRRGEVVGMRWDELSPDLAIWTLPASRTKNRRRHIVHLASEARAIIGSQPRFADCPLVFTTTGRGPIRKYSAAKKRLDGLAAAERREAGIRPAELPPWHLHDFRRTGATAMAALGVLSDVADRILNHQASSTNSGVKGVYQVHAFSAEREERCGFGPPMSLQGAATPVIKALANNGLAGPARPSSIFLLSDGEREILEFSQ